LTLGELLGGIGLSSAVVAGVIATRATARHGDRFGPTPTLTLICFLAIASVSLAQLIIAPSLLPLLMRDSVRVYSGQFWRLATSMLVQDGGWRGAEFNLIGLLAIGTVAERILGRLRWGVVAVISVTCAQSFALSWQPTGGGNSILNFGLAGAVCAVCLVVRPVPQRLACAAVASACFVFLLARHDIHGVAAVTGAFVAAASAFNTRGQNAGESAA
jgi:membrane associated rhomboid family serine protease